MLKRYLKPIEDVEIKFGIALDWADTGYMEEALKKVIMYLIKEQGYYIVISNFYDGNQELTQIKEKILQDAWDAKSRHVYVIEG